MGCIIASSDISGITFLYFSDQITTQGAISTCCDKSDGLSHYKLRA